MNASYNGLFVQYGCGLTAPSSWKNFDASPRLRFERLPVMRELLKSSIGLLFPSNVMYGDVTKRLPIDDNAADCVFCSHMLEHLSSYDATNALRETMRILKPGGIFRIVVPDLFWRASIYINSAKIQDVNASDDFMRQTLLGENFRARGAVALIKQLFGNSAHRWMFDYAGLSARLASVGFVAIRRCEFGDASHPSFKVVEQRDRFFEGSNAELSIEARKASS